MSTQFPKTNDTKRLVLFDIDGTLIHGGPLWKESFLSALSYYYPELEFPRVTQVGKTDLGGKTDVQICRELMKALGFTENDIEQALKKIIGLYLDKAKEQVQRRHHEVKILPGVVDLLERLRKKTEVSLGLLTGNVRDGANAKLMAAKLHEYFEFGVYCDDHWDRYQLPEIARVRAQDFFKKNFQGKEIVIIGDTIHDINCGKSLGVRTISVGTGLGTRVEDLLAQNPDYYFKDLSTTLEVVQAILEEI